MKALPYNTLIPDMPNEAYHGTKNTFSSSQLKTILEDPELFYTKYIAKTEPKEDIPAFDIGTYIHTSVLEPEKIDIDCAVFSGVRRGKAWEAFQEENKGKAIITENEHRQALTAVNAIKGSPIAMSLISKGESEVSAFVELKIFGGNVYCLDKVLGRDGWEKTDVELPDDVQVLIVKCRADCLGDGYILDVKSTTGNCRTADSIKKKVSQYQYDLSAAFYLDVFSAVKGESINTFIWTFASKDTGQCKNWCASRDLIRVGRAKWKKAIVEIARHVKAGWVFEDSLDILETNFYDREWLLEKEEDLL